MELGYKIHFDPEAFSWKVDNELSEKINDPLSKVIWANNLDTAQMTLNNLNQYLVKDIDNIGDINPKNKFRLYEMRKCKHCEEYFMYSMSDRIFDRSRGDAAPLYCRKCRKIKGRC